MTGARKENAIAAVCWMILGCVIAIWSATFPFGTREDQGPAIFPFGSGLALILFGGILLLQRSGEGGTKSGEILLSSIDRRSGLFRVVLSFGSMFLAAMLFDVLGFLPTIFCLILLLMRAIQPRTWRIDLFFTVVFTLGSYLLFKVLLKTTLPAGLLGF